MAKNMTQLIESYLPSKNPFWRRFLVFWFIFNWRLVYITFFVDTSSIANITKLAYLEKERFLFISDPNPGVYFLASFLFGFLLPYLAVKIYYHEYFYKNVIHDVNQSFKKRNKEEEDILSTELEVEFDKSELRKRWRDDYGKEIIDLELEAIFKRVFQVLKDGSKTQEDIQLGHHLGMQYLLAMAGKLKQFGYVDTHDDHFALTKKGLYLGHLHEK